MTNKPNIISYRSSAAVATAVTPSTPLPVSIADGTSASFTDRSGTIASGSVSQQVAAANTARQYFLFQNISDTDMWINFGTAAVADQPSIKVFANGGYYEPSVVPTQAINVICTSATKAFVAKEG